MTKEQTIQNLERCIKDLTIAYNEIESMDRNEWKPMYGTKPAWDFARGEALGKVNALKDFKKFLEYQK